MLSICMMLSSCGTTGYGQSGNAGTTAGTTAGTNAIDAILGLVLGNSGLTEQSIVGTWKYSNPGCAFTSENLLAKAGGEVAAQKIEKDLQSYYNKVGIKSSNTYITLNSDKTFAAMIDGKSFNGNYVLDAKNGRITLNSLLMSVPCYVQMSGSTMSFLFESKKLLQMFQTVAMLSNSTSLQTIGNMSTNFDGVRLGFDMRK